MVKIKLRGKRWGEDEPVIGGWADWMDEEGASGIEAMRSDKAPEGFLPVPSFLRGGPVPVRWKIEIWGKNLSRALAETDPSLEGLGPADPEFQEAIKKRIEVRDFSLTVHKLEGEVSLENIRKGALFDPFKVLGEWDYTRSLAEYESQEFLLHRGAIYIGELQLRMRLFFTEVDEGRADTPVEAYLRFICGSKVDFRVIGHQMRSRRIR